MKPPRADGYLQPGVALLAKIGSIVGHVEEGLSDTGHAFDWSAVHDLLNDKEVQDWMVAMRKVALVTMPRHVPPAAPPSLGEKGWSKAQRAGNIVRTTTEKPPSGIIKRVKA